MSVCDNVKKKNKNLQRVFSSKFHTRASETYHSFSKYSNTFCKVDLKEENQNIPLNIIY